MTIFLPSCISSAQTRRAAIMTRPASPALYARAHKACQTEPCERVGTEISRASRVVARPSQMTPLIRESGVHKATANAGGVLFQISPVRAISNDQSLSVHTAESVHGAAIKQPGSVL